MQSSEDTLLPTTDDRQSSLGSLDTLGPDDDGAGGGASSVRPPVAGLMRGDVVGRFLLLDKLGAGGMGVVYAAYDPELDRKVALKMLLGASVGDADARQRLLREAQALAKFSHPEIVAVHDVGTHASGVWIAMELVDGMTLGAWARQRKRTWREVLEVMLPAGRGVAAAHAAGLVHRDLKPDNIMISATGRVRVMDFGLTRSQAETLPTLVPTGERPREELLGRDLTHRGAVMGTPAYMAPEQFAGADVTAQADQFSFCVTLWELLFSERPFAGVTLAELAASVLDGRMRPAPRARRVPAWLRRTCVRGLARDPAARWPSMDVLLSELTRGQSQARTRKAVVVLCGLAIIGAGVEGFRRMDRADRVARCEAEGATIDAIWNEAERDRVRASLLATKLGYAAETADKVMPWLDAHAEAWRDAQTGACLDATVEARIGWDEAMLDRARWCLDERSMQFEAVIDQLSASDSQVAAKAVPAGASLTRIDGCRDLNFLARLPSPPLERREAVRQVRVELARVRALSATGSYAEGERAASEALAHAVEVDWPPLVAEARMQLGALLESAGDFEQAELVSEQAYFEASLAGAHEIAADAALGLVSTVGSRMARHAEGLRWSRLTEISHSAIVDPAGLWEANELSRRGNLLHLMGNNEEAREHHARALAIRERTLPPDHPHIAATLNNLANADEHLGNLAEALALHERALVIRERTLGEAHPDVGVSLTNLGNVSARLGRPEEARKYFERALALLERALGPEHPDLSICLNNLATHLDNEGDDEAAAKLLARALAIKEKTLAPDHPSVATGLSNLADVEFDLGRVSEAKAHYERALVIYEKARGADHPQVAYPLLGLAEVALVEKRADEAVALAERASKLRVDGDSDADLVGEAEYYLARALFDAGNRDAALAAGERARDRLAGVDEVLRDEVDTWLSRHR